MKQIIFTILIILLFSCPVLGKIIYEGTIETNEVIEVDGMEISARYLPSYNKAVIEIDGMGGTIEEGECEKQFDYLKCFEGSTSNGVEVIIRTESPDIEIERSLSTTKPSLGEEIDFEVTLTNNGEKRATVEYIDIFPKELVVTRGTSTGNSIKLEETISAGDSEKISYSVRATDLVNYESQATISYLDNNEEVIKKSEKKTIEVKAPYSILDNISNPAAGVGEIIAYTVIVENNEDTALKVNKLTVTLPSYVRATTWSKDLSKIDDKTFEYTGQINSGSSKDFLVNVKSVKIGEHIITTDVSVSSSNQDFEDQTSNYFSVGVSDIWAFLTVPEKIRSGNSFDLELRLQNNGQKDISGIDVNIESDLFDTIIQKGRSIDSGKSTTIKKSLIAPQIYEKESYEVKASGNYIQEGTEYSFESVKTVEVEPIPKALSITKQSPETANRGDTIDVDVKVKNLLQQQISLDAIEVMPSGLRQDLEGKVLGELTLNPNQETSAFSYSFKIPKDFSKDSFDLKTLINFELDGDSYKLEEVKTITVGGEIAEAQPEEQTENQDEPEETHINETQGQEEQKQGFFTKIINFFKNLFKKK